MTFLHRLPALPEGYQHHAGQGGVMACCPRDLASLLDAGVGPDGRHRGDAGPELADSPEAAGREPLGALEVDGVPCLARRFSHGGLARRITGRRFKDPARPFIELVLSERLRALGIPTPRVVAARAVPVRPTGYELLLITEQVPDVIDLGHVIGAVRRSEIPRSALEDGLVAAGRLIADLHRAGFMHADLQPANLLVRSGGRSTARAWVIDLDRSTFEGTGALPDGLRLKNLGRLWRHVRRREADYGAVLRPRDIVSFLRAYGTARGRCASLGRAIEGAAGEHGALHRVGWWLERRFGRQHDRRAQK